MTEQMGDMDEAIDARVGGFGYGFCHAQGICAIEKGIEKGCGDGRAENCGSEYCSAAA